MRQKQQLRQARKPFHLTPPQTITISFVLMILAGAVLLRLPIASRGGHSISFLDALFTSTSATCVTGLSLVNTLSHWTLFGQAVILLLIQFGALGIVTLLTLGMILLHRRVSLDDRLLIQTAFNQTGIGGMDGLVERIVTVTATFEGIGTVLFAAAFWAGGMPLPRALWKGLFHAVSSFCNAGIDVLGEGSLMAYRDNGFVLGLTMVLVVCGGLGFVVYADLLTEWRNKAHKGWRLISRLRRLALNTKLVLVVTAVLIALGTATFAVLEWENPATLGGLPAGQKLFAALFQSVTLRTAGFYTFETTAFTEASQFMFCGFMLAGGAPASAAGGVKIITLAVIFAAMLSVLRGRDRIEIFGRTLPLDLLQQALAVTVTVLLVVLGTTLVLYFTEQAHPANPTLLDLLIEASGAASTTGLSTGVTAQLSTMGKWAVALSMFMGRLSPVTVALALNRKVHSAKKELTYPEERVIIG